MKSDKKLSSEEKQLELKKYLDLVLTTIDYYLENKLIQLKTADFDSEQHFQGLKTQALEHFNKGRLSRLKQWFRDLTEPQIECGDFRFNSFIKERTKHDIDIFRSYYERIDNIIEKGKITTDNQFYNINMLVDQLSQTEPVDKLRIGKLNDLLLDYELRKIKKSRPHNNGYS